MSNKIYLFDICGYTVHNKGFPVSFCTSVNTDWTSVIESENDFNRSCSRSRM